MTRIWTAGLAAAGVALAAGAARADFGQSLPPAAPAAAEAASSCGGNADEVYGTHPLLRKLMFWKKDGGCKTCAKPTPLPPGYGTPGGPGGPQVGTLVFPQHPYVRGPRDYFMYEPTR